VVSIAALIGDQAARARIETASKGYAAVTFYDSAEQVFGAVADRAASVVVVDWRDSFGATVEKTVRTLRGDFPTVPVLIYSRLTPEGVQDILAGARAGATDVVIAYFDDIGIALNHRITSAQTAALADRMVSRVTEIVPESVAHMLGFFFRHAQSRPTVTAMAVALRTHPQTLARQCARAGLPTPSAFCYWARLILTAQRLEDPSRTTDRAAKEMGFPSGVVFRDVLKRYTGLRPSEVRERGGSTCLIELFSARLRAARPDIRQLPADRHHNSPPSTTRAGRRASRWGRG
jgi:AraC-like DNA-binding protein